jgi:heterodisulfide reductase subunit A-like polyferredoxin
VVGGGIAGIQASLDLAEAGFKVYLVEAKSAIGGHMAQLDKTFPTNDCAMCIVSPKLVQAGRHLNIDILTDTEVTGLSGKAGHFTATLRRKPRYIDLTKCTGCGDCEKVCPIVLPDHYNEGLARRHAAYRLYPQAIPAAYAIEKRGISPCRDACPVNTRAQGYIALVREGRYADALRVIKEENPFPGICGRICNHRCETACNRNQIDEPIAIKDLKRFIVDQVYAQPRQPLEPIARTRSERIAIIGSGPCGLTAAMDLAKQGYGVTVLEALPVAGGMLRVGVPEYRLPSWIADREVQDIVDLGVEIRLNTTVNSLDDVFAEGFKAVLIAVGAHEGKKLRIPGADLDGVLINTHFLRDVRLGNPPDLAGRHVLVLGGGNVAIDVARTAVRLGAKEVHLACLESREKMPAHPWEIADAEAEGVVMHPARSFTRILSDEAPARLTSRNGGRAGASDGNAHVAGVECVHVKFMEFDSEGRLNLETHEGSEHVLPCDTVIFSIGQAAGLAFIPADTGVGTTRRGTVAVNPNTLAATRPGVFAAGDSVTGTAFVIEAVAAGHRAAESIHLYLQGEALERPPRALELPVVKLTRSEIEAKIEKGETHVLPRVHMAARDVQERLRSFDEVELGYTEEEAQAEAARCLACGICSECLSCYYACGAGAVVHDMVEQTEEIEVGAVILAPGYEAYRAELSEEFGFGRYANVVTGLQFERLLSASGPTHGHVERPSDHQRPQRIAFLQCIGSRDQTHDYCSAVCCMYATKQAIMAKEHEPDTDIQVFMMDMRAFSKGYEEYYRRAQRKYKVQYTRCRVSSLKEDPVTHNLIIRYEATESSANRQSPNGNREIGESGNQGIGESGNRQSAIGNRQLVEEQFDLVVLSVGMEISNEVKRLGHDLGIELDDYGFCHTVLFDPLQTSRRGIYVAGPFREPKDIPETVVEASGTAAAAGELLATARGTLTRLPEYPPERDVISEAPRIGVFICHCGSNIAGYVDVPDVVEYTKTLPGVIHAENNLYTCSHDTIKHITEQIKELGLNRVVVASCTPRTHEPLFQDSLRMAGLNPYFFEMANIRNQCSWVHGSDHEGATKKARSLVRMAVGRATRLLPLHSSEVPVERAALVIGGGAAGLNAALSLAEQGFPVHLIERTGELGGNLRYVYYTTESLDQASDPQRYLRQLIARVQRHPKVNVYLQTELLETSGFVGNFVSRLGGNGQEFEVRHGATIVATGGQEYRGEEYACGNDPRVITQQEFEGFLANPQSASRIPKSVVMIQCVGPAARYCSRICCTTALKNALKLKELNPAAQVTMLFKDIRTYGFKERLYTQAREAGVMFVHYDDEHEPQVEISNLKSQISNRKSEIGNRQSQIENSLVVKAWEPMLGQELVLTPDLVVLSTPIVPAEGARELANRLKVPMDLDGFFLEAHVKLRPVDFASDGIFMAGLAHYPKFLDETIVQAQAAAARAAAILAQDTLMASARVAVVDADRCVACLTCVRLCPYKVPQVKATFSGVGGIVGAAHVEPAACHGCGICAAECPAKAIQLMHSTDLQMLTKIDSLFVPALLPT